MTDYFSILFLTFFVQNQLFTDCQSGLIPGNSCVSQLLSITQEIYKSFNCNPPEDKIVEGIIFKSRTFGVEAKLIMCLENYFKTKNKW